MIFQSTSLLREDDAIFVRLKEYRRSIMNVLVKYENDRILPYLYRNWLNRLDDNEKGNNKSYGYDG